MHLEIILRTLANIWGKRLQNKKQNDDFNDQNLLCELVVFAFRLNRFSFPPPPNSFARPSIKGPVPKTGENIGRAQHNFVQGALSQVAQKHITYSLHICSGCTERDPLLQHPWQCQTCRILPLMVASYDGLLGDIISCSPMKKRNVPLP